MGFSVSGAAGVMLIAGILAFGMAFTAASNGFEEISEANEDRSDRLLEQQNSDLNVTNVTHNATADRLNVTVENTGSIELSVDATSIVVDGRLQTGEINETRVEGNPDTDVWLPGEKLVFVIDSSSSADRVRVTAETGVSDLEVVTNG